MEFIAQILGWYFVLVGIVVIARRQLIMSLIKELSSNRPLLLVLGCIELAAGLALAIAYPQVGFSVAGVISLIGYIMIIESLMYLILPEKKLRTCIRAFNNTAWYIGGGLVSIALGGYLLVSVLMLA